MPSGVSDYGAEAFLGVLLGIDADPGGFYVALCSAAPGPAADGTILATLEPTDTAYTRPFYATGPMNWAASGRYASNLNTVTFAAPTEDWGYLTHLVLCTASSGGDIYGWSELNTPLTVVTGLAPYLPPGALITALSQFEPSINP